MEVQTKIILLSFAITIVLAFIIIPILKKLKIGQIERVEGPQSHLPPTYWFVASHSIQLSYWRILTVISLTIILCLEGFVKSFFKN